jgi:hypothetical protein
MGGPFKTHPVYNCDQMSEFDLLRKHMPAVVPPRYNIRHTRLHKTDTSVLIRSSKMYNKLPKEIRELDYKVFRRTTLYFLTKNCFYSVQEYMTRNMSSSEFQVLDSQSVFDEPMYFCKISIWLIKSSEF